MQGPLLEFIRKSEHRELVMGGDVPPATDWSRLLPPLIYTQSWHIFWKFISQRHYLPVAMLQPRLRTLRERVNERIRRRIAPLSEEY
jgi:hypothetical protein